MNQIPEGGSRVRLAVYLPGQCISGHEAQPFILLLEGAQTVRCFLIFLFTVVMTSKDGEDAGFPGSARGAVGICQRPFFTSEFPRPISPYCVLRAWEEGTLSQGAAEGRESQARWHALALTAKWPGGVPA